MVSLTPDFTYNQALQIIFNAFIEKYMYSISEIHRNDLQNIFPFARGARVKMARRTRARAGDKCNGQDKLTSPDLRKRITYFALVY